MKLVSFYTLNYKHYAENLKLQCESLNIDYLILERNYGNAWIDNVRAKPKFLLEMLNKLNEDFIWLDVDSEVLKSLDFTLNKWGIYLKENGKPHDFVHYIPKNSHRFLQLWISTINVQKKGSHTAFSSIIKNYSLIPKGYFKIGLSDNKSKRDYFVQ